MQVDPPCTAWGWRAVTVFREHKTEYGWSHDELVAQRAMMAKQMMDMQPKMMEHMMAHLQAGMMKGIADSMSCPMMKGNERAPAPAAAEHEH